MGDIMGTINKTAKTVTEATGGLLKSAKLNLAITSENENLKSAYIEVGKKVHEIYMYGGSLGKFFDDKYTEITEIEKRINTLKEQLTTIKGTRDCPKCGKQVDKSAEYCPKCGLKIFDEHSIEPQISEPINPEPIIAEPPSAPAAEPVVVKKCSICGFENQVDSKFCLSCGRFI